jgi:hypothetical protein
MQVGKLKPQTRKQNVETPVCCITASRQRPDNRRSSKFAESYCSEAMDVDEPMESWSHQEKDKQQMNVFPLRIMLDSSHLTKCDNLSRVSRVERPFLKRFLKSFSIFQQSIFHQIKFKFT